MESLFIYFPTFFNLKKRQNWIYYLIKLVEFGLEMSKSKLIFLLILKILLLLSKNYHILWRGGGPKIVLNFY